MDTSLILLLISMGAFWLILDEVYGHKYITNFVNILMPTYDNVTAVIPDPDANNDGTVSHWEMGGGA